MEVMNETKHEKCNYLVCWTCKHTQSYNHQPSKLAEYIMYWLIPLYALALSLCSIPANPFERDRKRER